MDKCVMALDGWVCATGRLLARKWTTRREFYELKRFLWYGMVSSAGYESKCRFTMLSARSSGSTHDQSAWDMCSFRADVENNPEALCDY